MYNNIYSIYIIYRHDIDPGSIHVDHSDGQKRLLPLKS